ncbi:MAG: hypothetical protein ACPGEE_00380 [Opitutales bacterium]|jgi:hypothetical protein
MNHDQKLMHLGEAYPDQKRQLFKYFRHQPAVLEMFVSSVDTSEYSLSDWLDALDSMSEWLTKKGRVMSLNDKIQYLNCATEIIDQGAHYDTMASAVHSILEQYGCERSSDDPNKNH